MRSTFLSRRLLGIQPDQDEGRRRRAHIVHHTLWRILLQDHALRAKKRRCHLPANDAGLPEGANRKKHASLRGRHRHQESKVQSIQRPIYYLSMLLTKSQQRHPHYQKLLLAIVMTSRKLAHYFDEHPITIASFSPLADILSNPGATGRVAEW